MCQRQFQRDGEARAGKEIKGKIKNKKVIYRSKQGGIRDREISHAKGWSWHN